VSGLYNANPHHVVFSAFRQGADIVRDFPLQPSRHLYQKWITPFVVMKFSIQSFLRNRDQETAAMLAFYGVFALIPLSLAVIFLLSQYFVSSLQASRAIENLIIEIVPEYHEIILREVFSLAEKKTAGIIGLLPLLWAVVPLVRSIRSAFFAVFKVERTGGFFKDKLIDFLAVFLFLLLLIALAGGEILYASTLGGHFGEKNLLLSLLDNVGPPLAGALFLSLFFLVFSPVRLEWWNLLLSAFVTACLWSVVRPLFVMFLHYNPNYGLIFGSLKAVFILIVWVYYTFAVILFGIELLSNIRRREALLLSRLFAGGDSRSDDSPVVPSRFIRSCEPGEVIFEEDSTGHEMFYILSGSVQILKKGHLLREMRTGDYFGEMAMLIQVPRTAAAVAAARDTRLVVISESNFDTIIRENPKIVLTILHEMSKRLRSLNEQLDDLPRTRTDKSEKEVS
jgi:membrane protein